MKNIKRITAMVLALAICCAPNLAGISAYDTTAEAAVILDNTETTAPTEEIVCAEPLGVIDVNQNPTKTEYAVGEELDLTGLKVTLRYFRGGEMYESELDDYEVIYDNVTPLDYPDIFVIDTSEFDSSTPGTYEITIKGTDEATGRYWMFGYGSFEVTVTEDVASDWIPQDYNEALTFLNTYGKTHVQDGLICTVRDITKSDAIYPYSYNTNITGEYELLSSETYEDTYKLEVCVYAPSFLDSSLSIEWETTQLMSVYLRDPLEHVYIDQKVEEESFHFSFSIDSNGKITQTDIFGVIPDCKAESDSFIKENGNIAVINNTIVFCGGEYIGGADDFRYELIGDDILNQSGIYDFTEYYSDVPQWTGAEYIVRTFDRKGKTGNTELIIYNDYYDDENNIVADEYYTIGNDWRIKAGTPEWAPTSFNEALTFINTYGRTFVKDGFICTVRDRRISKERFETNVSGDYSLVSSQVYEWIPDLSDYDEDMIIDVMQGEFMLEVNVYKPTAPTNISISWADYYLNSAGEEKFSENSDVTFEFEVAENGKITQTDTFGWMPDCVTEYESFVEKNGNVLVKDGYIGFVSEICTDAGYDLFFEQGGTGKVELTDEHNFYLVQAPIEAPGSANYMVEIYKPTTAGNVTLDWTTARDWEYDNTVMPICTKQLVINDDLTISNAEAWGDVDGDGAFAVSDAVVFNKYLVNKGSLFAINNADLNGDNKINVFDWLIMKKQMAEL